MANPEPAQPAAYKGRLLSAVIGGSVGQIFEEYDFFIFSTLAFIFASQIFPSSNILLSLIYAYAVYAVGFFFRPLGSLIFGGYADKVGRKRALLITFTIMGIATVLQGAVPTYAEAGALGAILLIILRIIQGTALGGEVPLAMVFLSEVSPKSRRGFLSSWQGAAGTASGAVASAVGLGLTYYLARGALYSYGWRLGFFIGGIVLVVGLIFRYRINETPIFQDMVAAKTKAKSITESLRFMLSPGQRRALFTIIGITIFDGIAFSIFFIYFPTYAKVTLGLSAINAFGFSSAALLITFIMIPFFAMISDKVGRKPLLYASMIGGIVLTYPLYLLLTTKSLPLIFIGAVSLDLIFGLFLAVDAAVFNEISGGSSRGATVSFGFTIDQAIFGGLAPFIVTYLLYTTKSEMSPSFLAIGGAIVSLIFIVFFVKETKNTELSRGLKPVES